MTETGPTGMTVPQPGRLALMDMTVIAPAATGSTLGIEAAGTATRYAHRITRAGGMAGRRLRVTLTATAARS